MKKVAKKITLLSLLMFLGVFAYAQTATTHQWSTTTHDFGKLEQNKPAQCEFKITNKGTTPLIITSTTPSCGCTVPEYTKDPIAPGKTGFVKATYNAASPGQFTKTITVVLSNNATEVLTIKGEVNAAKTTNDMMGPVKQ
jgi:hypothetical protein